MHGKSISAGFIPVSGIFAGKKLMDALIPGSTFCESPFSVIVAIATIAEICRQKLHEQSTEQDAYTLNKLKKLAKKIKVIKEVRGPGLMIGIELEHGDKNEHDYCVELVKDGLIVKETHDWVIRIFPPITSTKGDVEFVLSCFTERLK